MTGAYRYFDRLRVRGRAAKNTRVARAAAPLAGAGRVRRQAATAPRDREAAAVGFTPVQLISSTPAHLAPLLRSVDVIGLQRTAGNRAVVSLLVPALVQRDTDTFGLLKKDEVTGFAVTLSTNGEPIRT